MREFWGESIKRFWDNIFTTQGALGGAIWGGIDDVLITPRGYTQWEWGIYDGWRREKPEYWLTKKAYSPIRVPEEPLTHSGKGRLLRVPIQNRFDHTNLSEIAVHWSAGADAGVFSGPDLAPHCEGVLEVPARDWADGEVLNLKFYRMEDLLVDEYNLGIGDRAMRFPEPQGPPPGVSEDAGDLTVSGADFEVVFSKATGQIVRGTYKGSDLVTGGPHLNLVGIELAPWAVQDIRTAIEESEAVVHISGRYGPIAVRFEVRIDGCGLITTTYTLDDLPVRPPRRRRLRVGIDVGGYREVGVAYRLSHAVDQLTWERDGLWSAYPEDHIGRTAGRAARTRQGGDEGYGQAPAWSYGEDMREYALFGKYDVGDRGTRDFRSMKHNIWYASAVIDANGLRVRAESDGTDAVRLQVLDKPGSKVDARDPAIRYAGTWIPMDDDRAYHGVERVSNKAGDYAEFTFEGTGVAWIGSKDMIHGQADVLLDGKPVAAGLDLYGGLAHGSSRGEEKLYQVVLYSIEGLQNKEHTIRVVVTGQKDLRSNNAYVSINAFQVLDTQPEGDVLLIVNNAWNYPELTWGNYVKDPIAVETGYTNTVRMRLTDSDRETGG